MRERDRNRETGQEAHRRPDLVPRVVSPAPGPAALALQLQSRVGNAIAAQALARQSATAPVTAPAPVPIASAHGQLANPAALVASGVFGPDTVIPGVAPQPGHAPPANAGPPVTGGFTALYDPADGRLTIRMLCAVRFVNGMRVNDHGAVVPGHPRFAAAAAHAPAPGPARTAFLQQWQWSSAQRNDWLRDLRQVIRRTWEPDDFGFSIDAPGWQGVAARVNIDLQLRELHGHTGHAGTRDPGEHLSIRAIKVPDDGSQTLPGSVGTGSHGSAFDQSMTLASTHVRPRADNPLQVGLRFAPGADNLDGPNTLSLSHFATEFTAATGPGALPPTVDIISFAPAPSGGSTAASGSAERRAENVRGWLERQQFGDMGRVAVRTVEAGDPQWSAPLADYVIVQAGNASVPQIAAAHEFGHAVGLGDQYVNRLNGSTGAPPGTPSSHAPLVAAMPVVGGHHMPPSIHQGDDSIMSNGNIVLAQHYATFYAALRQVTGISEWAFGLPRGRAAAATPAPHAPTGAGPAPPP